jgi:hypothetical protein
LLITPYLQICTGRHDAIPPSAWLLEQIHLYLSYLCDVNSEIFLPNQFAASTATIQAFVNGAIGIWFPSQEWWIQAYSDNTEMSAIHDLILNPSKINLSTLNAVNHNYRALLWQSQIVIEDGLLITTNLCVKAYLILTSN